MKESEYLGKRMPTDEEFSEILKKIKEKGKVKRFRGKRSFTIMMAKEAKPTIMEEVHEIRSMGNYLKT